MSIQFLMNIHNYALAHTQLFHRSMEIEIRIQRKIKYEINICRNDSTDRICLAQSNETTTRLTKLVPENHN